jgi:hypothetical protein
MKLSLNIPTTPLTTTPTSLSPSHPASSPTPGSDSSIIIIGGAPKPAFNHQLTDNSIIIIGGGNPFDAALK